MAYIWGLYLTLGPSSYSPILLPVHYYLKCSTTMSLWNQEQKQIFTHRFFPSICLVTVMLKLTNTMFTNYSKNTSYVRYKKVYIIDIETLETFKIWTSDCEKISLTKEHAVCPPTSYSSAVYWNVEILRRITRGSVQHKIYCKLLMGRYQWQMTGWVSLLSLP
jgi:hypothetical protein